MGDDGGGAAASSAARSRCRRVLWLLRMTPVTPAIVPATISPPKKSASAAPAFARISKSPIDSPIATGTRSRELSRVSHETVYAPAVGALKSWSAR